MSMVSEIINSNDYPVIIVSILKNTKVYNLIDKEYSKNKINYDEVILRSKILKNKRFNMIPESMINYGIKLTGILLSKNGECFFRKILQEGWPQLYSYIRDCNEIIYEDVTKIKEYEAEFLGMHSFYIVILLGMLHDKQVSYKTNEGKSFGVEFVKWHFSITDDDIDIHKFNKVAEHKCTRVLKQLNKEKILEKRFTVDKNKNMFVTLAGLLQAYDISFNDELGDYFTSMNLNDEDKELLNIYAVSSKCLLDNFLDNDVKKREMMDFVISARFLQGMIKKYQILYKAYIELYKNNLIDGINLNNKIEQQERTNEKLVLENQQLKEELGKVKADKRKYEKQELIESERKYKSIIQDMNEMVEECKGENEFLKTMIESLLDESRYIDEEQITTDALIGTRGVIIGGTPQWQQHMRKVVPHFKFIEAEQLNYDTKILENADKIYLNTAYNSHALFYKTINVARKNQIKVVLLNSNSVTTGFRMLGQNSSQFTGEHLVS
ncbi:hypothetical protein EV204_101318 [Tissierella praeacuta]|uniref:hypothetical protein n=1 Tax=Tissierella praeacuta TaxID=43131 RepID=UPI0010444C6B|nr:hypothetical protein [Tissierella praeacuta]TCU79339.1 hypothetical protein EV204_101318 [Tissierella praeacuta]